ncbi:hypothetical protein FRX31_024729 [Thalictrum thalictroides]|uniref:Uncharacterized protein n=1 Tax=Thalictrum thalictroides TaxID=46969 RepID=A0A7J6VKP3_THATH|nr:hypothetical protein FRX31_024729 [Thalictrum thalictroides]
MRRTGSAFASAGYDPKIALTLHADMDKNTMATWKTELLSTHPLPKNRKRESSRNLTEASILYKKS